MSPASIFLFVALFLGVSIAAVSPVFGDCEIFRYDNRGKLTGKSVVIDRKNLEFRGNEVIRAAEDWPAWKTDVCHYYFFKVARRVIVDRECLFCHNLDRTLRW